MCGNMVDIQYVTAENRQGKKKKKKKPQDKNIMSASATQGGINKPSTKFTSDMFTGGNASKSNFSCL